MKRKRGKSQKPSKRQKVFQSIEVEKYYKKIKPNSRYDRIMEIRNLILSSNSNVDELLFKGMVIFQTEEKGDFYVGLASRKNYVAIYFAEKPFVAHGEFIENIKKNCVSLKTGDATIQLKDKDEIPTEELEKSFKMSFE